MSDPDGRFVYECGYSGRTPSAILHRAQELDALVFDIRLSPFSKNPIWNRDSMVKVFGSRYVHVGELGNLAYRSGGIKIKDLELGMALIDSSLKPVILLCVCGDYETCHRRTVIEALEAEGWTRRPLFADGATARESVATGQLDLFPDMEDVNEPNHYDRWID